MKTQDQIIDLCQYHLATNPDRLRISEIQKRDFGQYYQIESDAGLFLLRLAYADDEQALFYEKDMLRREVALQQLIRDHTDMPLPELIVADFERHHLDRDYLISRDASGLLYSDITSLSHAQHDRVYQQLGTYLRQLHQVESTTYGYHSEATTLASQPGWMAAFTTLWQQLMDDVVSTGLYTRQEGQGLRDLFEAYAYYFERAEPAILLHMGIRKENIKVDLKGNVTGILSSELAVWGEPELEFAVLDCAGIWASAFWEGYGTARLNDLGSRTRRKFYILYEVLKNIPLALIRHEDLEEAEQYKQTATTIATNLAATGP